MQRGYDTGARQMPQETRNDNKREPFLCQTENKVPERPGRTTYSRMARQRVRIFVAPGPLLPLRRPPFSSYSGDSYVGLIPLNVGSHALILLLLSQQEEPISSFRVSKLFLPIPVSRSQPNTSATRLGQGRTGGLNLDSGGRAGPAGHNTIAFVQA